MLLSFHSASSTFWEDHQEVWPGLSTRCSPPREEGARLAAMQGYSMAQYSHRDGPAPDRTAAMRSMHSDRNPAQSDRMSAAMRAADDVKRIHEARKQRAASPVQSSSAAPVSPSDAHNGPPADAAAHSSDEQQDSNAAAARTTNSPSSTTGRGRKWRLKLSMVFMWAVRSARAPRKDIAAVLDQYSV